MTVNKIKSSIIITIVFLLIVAFTGIAFSANEKKTSGLNAKLKVATQEIKIQPVSSTKNPSENAESKPLTKSAPQRSSEIVFVLDNSGSMKKNDPNRITPKVVTNFIKNVATGSRIGMVIFGEDARILEPITEISDSATRIKFINSLKQIDYRGQRTNTPSGIERAIYELKTSGKNNIEKAIILLTDGLIDTGDKNRDKEEETWLKEQLAGECRDLGIKIYGIAFTDKADFRLIQILATKTDGEYFRIYTAEEIQPIFDRINTNIAAASLKKESSAKNASAQVNTASPPPPKAQPVVTPKPGSQIPKKPTLRKDTPKSSQTALDTTTVNKKKLSDILPVIFLMAIILAALIFFLMMHRSNKQDSRRRGSAPGGPAGNGTSRRLRPEIQAELIDVEHIIPQDSVSLTIDKSSISIGRDSSNDIVIPQKVVSSLHATIEYRNGYYFLEDNRSTNGTRLNNRRIEPDTKMKLKSGDVIHFANSEFRFLIHDQAPYGETMVINTGDIQP